MFSACRRWHRASSTSDPSSAAWVWASGSIRTSVRAPSSAWRLPRSSAARCSSRCSCRRWRRLGYRFRPDFHWRDPGVKAILLLMGPAVIAASTTQFNVLVNSMFASTLGDGAIFWLAIAFRLMQLPLGLFGVALGTVTLPLLSRLVVAAGMDGVPQRAGARHAPGAFLLTVPSTVGLMMLAEPIISVLYQHGKFTAYRGRRGRGCAALLCHRPWRLCGAQGAGQCVLRVGEAQDPDAGELYRRRHSICCSTGSSLSVWGGDIAALRSRRAASRPSISCCCIF